MTSFPLNRIATQQEAATLYLDPALTELAAVKLDGVPQPGSVVQRDPDGLWPLITVDGAAVLYYRTPSGRVATFLPAIGAGVTAPIVLTESTEDNPALVELINALQTLGLPIVNATDTKPVIEAISPDTGSSAGGLEVTLTGYGFTNATGVTFDGEPGTEFAVLSDTEIRVITPAHEGGTGTFDVVVTDPDGDSDAGDFDYVDPAAVLTSISPTTGDEAGGTTVTFTGEWFADATGVLFDATPGTDFAVVDDQHITAKTPAHAAGATTARVQSPNGNSGTRPYTYTA